MNYTQCPAYIGYGAPVLFFGADQLDGTYLSQWEGRARAKVCGPGCILTDTDMGS